ncbi:MAG: EscN/YscN/HrcN family type III secretion system ATPase, partial [Helicobacter sp.]|nr:EscN/YscN/HrcN family type III secretion system ATPase [Helicobacter sp.]
MSLQEIRQKLKNTNLSPSYGSIIKIMPNMIVASGIRPSVGDIIEFSNPLDSLSERSTKDLGMVSAIEKDHFYINPFSFVEGRKSGDYVRVITQGLQIPVGNALLGRVIN